MADPRPSSPAILASNPQYSNPESNNLNQQPDPSSQPDSSTPSTSNSSPYAPTVSLQPPMMTSYTSPPISGATTAVPPAMPSFRPVQQFPPFLSYPTPGVPPPGVSSSPAVPPGSAPISMMQYQIPPGHPQNPALRPFAPNGYAAMPVS